MIYLAAYHIFAIIICLIATKHIQSKVTMHTFILTLFCGSLLLIAGLILYFGKVKDKVLF